MSPLLFTLLGIVGLLVIATIISLWGVRKFKNALWNNIWERVVGWWEIVGVLALACYLGNTVTIALFAIVSVFALREFLSIAPTVRADHRTLAWTFYALIPLQYGVLAFGWYNVFVILIPVYGFILLSARNVAAYGQQDVVGFMGRTATIFWAQMLCIYCVSYIPAILSLTVEHSSGVRLMLFLILMTQGSDIAQYIWGKTIGKHKIAPMVSPNKTVEGLLGGMATMILISPLFCYLTGLPWYVNMVLTAVTTLLGFFGGLTMSAIKRDRQVKDWGHLIIGHGGVLDRIDSLTFSAPIFFHLVRYFLTQ